MLNLKVIMRANAVSCLLFGVLFILLPSQVSAFLAFENAAPDMLISVIGYVLIFNSFHLIWASNIPMPKRILILYFSAGDFIWTIASVTLILCGLWVTTTEGIIATILIAITVGLFGVLQMIYRKAMGNC